jgi:hypothetical protein
MTAAGRPSKARVPQRRWIKLARFLKFPSELKPSGWALQCLGKCLEGAGRLQCGPTFCHLGQAPRKVKERSKKSAKTTENKKRLARSPQRT